MKILKFAVISVFLLLILGAHSAFAADQTYFSDEFDGTSLDSTKWQSYQNNGSIQVNGGVIQLSSGRTSTFPYVYSKNNPFPETGDFSLEFTIQYTNISPWGTGFVVGTQTPVNATNPTGDIFNFWVWQDTTTGNQGFRLNFGPDKQVIYSKLTQDYTKHTVKLDYASGIYKVFLDNSLIYTSGQMNLRPKVIWFGNPVDVHSIPDWNWTAFQLDYVRVLTLESQKTPLIFIPGIGGSELKVTQDTIWNKDNGHGGTYNRAYSAGEKVWVNEGEAAAIGDDDYFDVLRMKPDGQTSEANLELTGSMYAGSYQQAIDFFVANGYTLNQNLFIFPYDWRKDIALTSPLLDQKIEAIKQQTGTQKVDIVAHSLGGLVARNYINDPSKAFKVRKLITLGTPHLGAVDFLKKLQYGGCLAAELGPFCFSINPSEVKDIAQNMISGYELAPSQKYYEFYNGSDRNHPLPFVDNRDIGNNGVTGFLSYQQLKTTLTNLGYNTALFNPTETFHNLDNNLNNLNGVDVSIISGSGQATTGQIIEDYAINFAGIKIPKTDIRKINGDDTVSLFSSSLTDSVKSITGSAKVYYASQHHSDLVSSGPAMNLVKNILVGDSAMPSGTNNQPYAFSGNALSVHSPVLIHAYDQSGDHTGPLPNGDYEAKIPGSSYEVLGDAKFIWLPDSGQYTVKFEATGQGTFDFKIRNYANDVNDKTILYNNIPLTTNTKAETIFNTAVTQPPVLQVDQDGNGTVDTQVNSSNILTGDANYDETPPKTTVKISGITGNNGWYKSDAIVELNATDETNGSGIAKTEYSLDNGQTIKIYTQPFPISQEGINKLKFRSKDQAGNEETPQEVEIKIDKTTPEAKISFNLQNQTLEITGSDNLTAVQISGSAEEQVLTDEAGNITKLQFKPDEKDNEKDKDKDKDKNKEKEDDKEKEQEKEKKKKRNKLELKSISYNNGNIIKFPENKFEAKLELDKKTNNVKEFTQSIEIEKQIEIKTDYNPKKDRTSLEIKIPKDKKQKEEKPGIVILNLLTNKGNLEVKY